jgi:hypothetical protein
LFWSIVIGGGLFHCFIGLLPPGFSAVLGLTATGAAAIGAAGLEVGAGAAPGPPQAALIRNATKSITRGRIKTNFPPR